MSILYLSKIIIHESSLWYKYKHPLFIDHFITKIKHKMYTKPNQVLKMHPKRVNLLGSL